MSNPYLSKVIVPEIANEWKTKGYGTTWQLKYGTYLLYHKNATSNDAYHIHNGNSYDGRMGWLFMECNRL